MIHYTKDDQLRFDQYHKILASMEPKIFRAFSEALAAVDIQFAQITELYSAGKLNEILRLIDFNAFDTALEAAIIPELERIAVRGQVWSKDRLVGDIPALSGLSFAVLSPEVQNAIITQAGALIKFISDDQIAAVSRFLLDAHNAGAPATSVAAAISDVVGLNPRQSAAIGNFNQAVDDVFNGTRSASAVERQYKLAPKIRGNREKIKQRYAARQRQYRGRLIARHETIKAFSIGRHGAWQQMLQEGALTKGAVVEWVTTPDERACPICVPLHGLQADVTSGVFMGTNEAFIAPPAHISCRCDTIIVLQPKSRTRTPARREADKFISDRLDTFTEAGKL